MEILRLLKASVLILLKWITNTQLQYDIIQTSSGPIRGTEVNIDGHTVYQYLGIPFAQPPVGDLRFRKPQPVQPCSETLEANKMPPACMQFSIKPYPWYDFQPGKSEDCLYLNIWVPEDTKVKKAVMFWIFSGAFTYGSIQKPIYNGRALAAVGDVIVVTANYRVGAFGFYTTNTEDAPVNVVLYDTLEALKWVNKNIGAFGGDPNQVTLFGESAGAILTGLLCVSPLTQGLFNRVIMESGSPAYIFSDDNSTSLQTSQKLAEKLGCADSTTNIFTSPYKVTECMREVDAFEIAKTLHFFPTIYGNPYFPTYGNEILPDNARLSLIAGKFHDVSVLIGNVQNEGADLLTSYKDEIFGFFGEKRDGLNVSEAENLLEDIFKAAFKGIPNADVVQETILGNLREDDYRENVKIVYDFMGDAGLLCPSVYFAESYSRYGQNAFFYLYEHRPSITPFAEWMGANHFDEVQFVFGSPLKENKYTGEEVELSRLMMKMWSNFAKYGDPSVSEWKSSNQYHDDSLQNDLWLEKWPTYSREMPLYLVIDTNTRKRRQYKFGPHKENCDLFRKISGFS